MKLTIFLLAFLSLSSFAVSQTKGDWSCGFIKELEKSASLECGHLAVPENHDAPKGRSIKIAYAVIKSNAEKPKPDPMIFFSGGPGGGSLDPGFIGYLATSPINQTRDIILFDQRGINYSTALPDIGRGVFEAMAANVDMKGEAVLIKKTLSEFKAKAKKEGIEFGDYNTLQNARDVGALMDHLGYKRYNLFGISYGTRLARKIQDLYPEKLNSVTLDSPNLMTEDFLIDRMKSYSGAAEKVLKFCDTDETCKKDFPDLRSEYVETVKSYEKEPLEIKLVGSSFFVNPQDAVYFLRRQLYSNDATSRFPNFVKALKERDEKIIGDAVRSELEDVSNGSFNSSMFLAVSAFESMDTANTPSVVDNLYKELPHFPAQLGFFTGLYFEGMNFHDKRLTKKQRAFSMSKIPTIIFVNQYDPITPPENGALFQKQLSQSHLYILDLGGHSGGDMECKMKMMSEFMDTPGKEPDSGCLDLYDSN